MSKEAAQDEEQRIIGAIEEIGHHLSHWLKQLIRLPRIFQGREILHTDRAAYAGSRSARSSLSGPNDRCKCGMCRLQVNHAHELIAQSEGLLMGLSLLRPDEELFYRR